MYAYQVFDCNYYYSVVVFAESPTKAKSYAFYSNELDGSDYTELRARRIKQLDKYYKPNKYCLSWYIDEDRLALVKDGGYRCEDPSFECKSCIARKYCDTINKETDNYF